MTIRIFCLELPPLPKPIVFTSALLLALAAAHSAELGIFENETDIGRPEKAGHTSFDPAPPSYSVSGGGENMWFTNDAFHFVWKRVSADFALQAAISWPTEGGNAHRKACLMVRQSLEADAPYIDVAVHGDGLTSLQFRETPNGLTHEIQANLSKPAAVGICRQGEVFYLAIPGAAGQSLSAAGPAMRIRLSDPVYVGLAVCSHDDKVLETARFAKVELTSGKTATNQKPTLHSTIEIVPIRSKDRRVVYHTCGPARSPELDSRRQRPPVQFRRSHFPFTGKGWNTGMARHGFCQPLQQRSWLIARRDPIGDQRSVPWRQIAHLHCSRRGRRAQTDHSGGSVLLAWLVAGWLDAGILCGAEWRIRRVYCACAGGEEKRLTTAKGLDDGPEYTPDGKFIYFNSDRTGLMQIWRMKPDGSDQEQVTSDDFNNWFAHPSPDGKWIVFLSYAKDVTGHPANKPVRLRLMPLGGGPIQELARLFGGQGTMNVPSWSPDSPGGLRELRVDLPAIKPAFSAGSKGDNQLEQLADRSAEDAERALVLQAFGRLIELL